MAKTGFETSDAATKKVWEEKLFRDTPKSTFFANFMGETQDSLVHVKTQLEKGKGDKIYYSLIKRLEGDPIIDGVLEGNEEASTTYTDGVEVHQYRIGVRVKGKIDVQRVTFSITKENEALLKARGAEVMDELCFDALTSSPTVVCYPNSSGVATVTNSLAAAKAGLSATNSLITPNFISFLKVIAKTGNDRAFIPVRPIRIEGKDHYVLLVHDKVAYDLKTNSAYQQYVREAEVRGPTNPLFTGSIAIIDGVVIHAHETMPIAADGGGASVKWNQASLMGAQALCWAWGQRPEVIMKTFDYDNEVGYAWEFIGGIKKPSFNSADYGSIGVALARSI